MTPTEPLPKLATAIPGFDHISRGGIPKLRTTLVSGAAGSAKTVLAAQFLAAGVEHHGEPGVFLTFEESADDIRANIASFGWDIETWERNGVWRFVDASPRHEPDTAIVGSFDFGALIARVEHAVRDIGAVRCAVDSLDAVFGRFPDSQDVRREMHRFIRALKDIGVTVLMTSERPERDNLISRHGVEEFVADNVVILRNRLEAETRRRTIEILKFRGANHAKGEFPFTIVPGRGIVTIPLTGIELKQRSTNLRTSSGNPELDEMCGGGYFRDSVILVSGATGTGKTLTATEFMAGGAAAGERCLLFGYEESHDQIFRNAAGWGYDFDAFEKMDRLKVVCMYPETASLEDHLVAIEDMLDEYQPDRFAVDSMSALERVATTKGVREFVIGLTSMLKERQVTGLLTSTAAALLGGPSVTHEHTSTLTDTIILLRYVEVLGEVKRAVTVLKMRGSPHDRSIREFEINQTGMHIGRAFRNVGGILAGSAVQLAAPELERVAAMFGDEDGRSAPGDTA